MDKPTENEEADAIGCFLYIGLAFIIIGSVWAFGSYGMIGVGVAIITAIFFGVYRAVVAGRKNNG